MFPAKVLSDGKADKRYLIKGFALEFLAVSNIFYLENKSAKHIEKSRARVVFQLNR